MNDDDVTVVIPTIPVRRDTYLPKALNSAFSQEHPPAAVNISVDIRREGAWVNRQRGLEGVATPWVAFLDDDDEFYPDHLRILLETAAETGADYVFSYWDLNRTPAILGPTFGRRFDPLSPHHTTMTVMVRTPLAQKVGFTAPAEGQVAAGEDWRFTLGCIAEGAHIVHAAHQTWFWRHHSNEQGSNTSGRPENVRW